MNNKFAILLVLATCATPAVLSAPDLAVGKSVFGANCAACHAGGRNNIKAEKNLKLAALKQYQMDAPAAIVKQVTYGKPPMPAFGKKLTPVQIESVAAYVLAQANKDWKN